MAIPIQVTFDAADPVALSRFWATALGYVEQPPPDGMASWDEWARRAGVPEDEWDDSAAIVDPDGVRPRLLFQKVPEGRTAKNRMHLDVNAGTPDHDRDRVEAHVEKLVAAGADVQGRVEEHDQYWVVMTDPEGNEFCVQ
jgi:hypothetical protein